MIKTNRVILAAALSLAAISAATAATKPSSVFEFDTVNKSSVFSVTAKGWSDPAFGDAGWTHSGGWGKVTVKKGQTVTITAIADNKSVHPGSTVWYRGADDTADDAYVNDHFYQQNANIFKSKASDDSAAPGADGKPVSIGNIVMKYVTHGFDLDKNAVVDENGAADSEKITALKGKKDSVPGKLTLSFKARYDGTYMFVVGGFNPNSSYVATTGADGKTLKESVKVSLSVN